MKYLLVFSLAATVALSGCTWFQGNGPAEPAAPAVEQGPDIVGGGDPDLRTLDRPDLGFSLSYGATYEYRETTSCVEGCPAGSAVPAYVFGNSTTPDLVTVIAYPDEDSFLLLHMAAAETLQSYLASDAVREVEQTPTEDGARYSYTTVGRTADDMSMFPSVPDRSTVLLVDAEGRMYQLLSDGSTAAQPLLAQLASSFAFSAK